MTGRLDNSSPVLSKPPRSGQRSRLRWRWSRWCRNKSRYVSHRQQTRHSLGFSNYWLAHVGHWIAGSMVHQGEDTCSCDWFLRMVCKHKIWRCCHAEFCRRLFRDSKFVLLFVAGTVGKILTGRTQSLEVEVADNRQPHFLSSSLHSSFLSMPDPSGSHHKSAQLSSQPSTSLQLSVEFSAV